jgi:hypothetical protein
MLVVCDRQKSRVSGQSMLASSVRQKSRVSGQSMLASSVRQKSRVSGQSSPWFGTDEPPERCSGSIGHNRVP